MRLYGGKFSFIEVFFNKKASIEEMNDEFPLEYQELLKNQNSINTDKKSEFIGFINQRRDEVFLKQYLSILNNYANSDVLKMKKSQQYDGELWLGFYDIPFNNGINKSKEFNYFLNNVIHQLFVQITLETQNEFRISKGLPKIGEGWVSETELFYLLKEEFVTEIVQQHGKPKWLGRQHVDIWFPDYGIGIEYQGLQHDQPIDFFGGEIGFESNKKRDERKKKLFIENGCILIEVRSNYEFKLLVEQIRHYMEISPY
jgi:hypothetical protein